MITVSFPLVKFKAVEFKSTMAARPQKPQVLDLAKHLDKAVTVKFQGGREVSGVLKGFDPLVNLVLDEAVETLRGVLLVLLIAPHTGQGRPTGRLAVRPPALPAASAPTLSAFASFSFYVGSHSVFLTAYVRAVFVFDLFLTFAVSHVPRVQDPEDPYRLTDKTRKLGLLVCRGTGVMIISPVDGTEEIANPFLQQ